MNGIRALIVDDEALAREVLQARLADYPDIEVIGVAADGEDGLEAIERLKPDLLFLDIQMPRRTGMSLARALVDMSLPVVFVTANPVFAAEAFEVAAVDYVLKPVQPDRLATAVARARRRLGEMRLAGAAAAPAEPASVPQPEPEAAEPAEPRPTVIWVPKRDRSAPIGVDEIEWIEAARDYVLLHTARQAHLLRTTMDNLVAKLDPTQMVRISRSVIINLAWADSVQEHGKSNMVVIMRGGAALKVGATYLPIARRTLGRPAADRRGKG